MSLKPEFHTFGCKVNTYDTGLLQTRLEDFDSLSQPVHILNTCAVTAEATKEAIRKIRKIKRNSPESKVVVTGCAAQVDGAQLDQLAEADLIVANSHKGQIKKILNDFFNGENEQKVFRANIFKEAELGLGGGIEEAHTRAFLKIQDGCNSFCSYCIIPYTRGKSRSLAAPEMIKRVNELYSKGIREVVITGIHLGDYLDEESSGGPYDLEDLLESLLHETSMPRFRVSSLEPLELSDRLIELYKDERLCPHFHMSIQSAEDQVLKDMKRNYLAKDVEGVLNKIQKNLPGAFVGMDVIVGFPTETQASFEETLKRLQSLDWTRIHVFPYSERPGTRAAELMSESVPVAERKERSKILRTLSTERFSMKALDEVGKTKKCLALQSKKSENSRGFSRDGWNIQLNSNLNILGREVQVKILGFDQSESSRMEGVHYGELV